MSIKTPLSFICLIIQHFKIFANGFCQVFIKIKEKAGFTAYIRFNPAPKFT